jgi:hypothetical protein
LRRAFPGGLPLARVRGAGQSVPGQRCGYRVVRHRDLGADRGGRLVPDQVPVAQVAGHVGETQRGHRLEPPGTVPVSRDLPDCRSDGRVYLSQMPVQPVSVQSGFPADRGQAGSRRYPGQHIRTQSGMASIPGHLGGYIGPVPGGAIPAGLRCRLTGRGGRRPGGLAAALLGQRAASAGTGRVLGQFTGGRALAARRAARADGRVEDQPGRERRSPALPCLLAFQGLASFQAEGLAVVGLGPAMHAQVGGYRLQRPAAQMAGDGGAVSDDLPDRGVVGRPVRQYPRHRPDHTPHSRGPLRGPRLCTGRLGGHPCLFGGDQ